jgi:hypothetical protein
MSYEVKAETLMHYEDAIPNNALKAWFDCLRICTRCSLIQIWQLIHMLTCWRLHYPICHIHMSLSELVMSFRGTFLAQDKLYIHTGSLIFGISPFFVFFRCLFYSPGLGEQFINIFYIVQFFQLSDIFYTYMRKMLFIYTLTCSVWHILFILSTMFFERLYLGIKHR